MSRTAAKASIAVTTVAAAVVATAASTGTTSSPSTRASSIADVIVPPAFQSHTRTIEDDNESYVLLHRPSTRCCGASSSVGWHIILPKQQRPAGVTTPSTHPTTLSQAENDVGVDVANTRSSREQTMLLLSKLRGGDVDDNARPSEQANSEQQGQFTDAEDATTHHHPRSEGKGVRTKASSASTRKKRSGSSASSGPSRDTDNSQQTRTTRNSSSSSSHNKSKSSSKTTTLPIVNEILQHDDYYEVLGLNRSTVDKSSKPDTIIQKAYRKRAVLTHPDKTGGDRRAFDKVAQAYEVLSDPQKRKLYNRYGKKGVEASASGGGGGMRPEDIFQSFFGSGTAGSPFGSFGHQYYQQQQQRNRSMRFEVEVSLEDLYVGKTMTVTLPAQFGRKNSKQIDITIPRGALHNQQIVASGVIDGDRDQPPGDAYFYLKQRQHPIFTRKGHDLAIGSLQISLSEALAGGVYRTVQHLDGRLIHIASAPSSSSSSSQKHPDIIHTGDVHVLKGAGMPKDAVGTEYGDLYIQYEVQMPTTSSSSNTKLTESERTELQRLLQKLEGKSPSQSPPTEPRWPFSEMKDVKVLQKGSLSNFGRGFEDPQEQPQQQRFYWSSSSSSSGFPFGAGGNPFFGSSGPNHGEDLGETQCQQM